MPESRFASLSDLTAQEQMESRTRAFKGSGNPFLEMPGNKTVEHVRIGMMELPLSEMRPYPINATGAIQEVEEPLVKQDRRSDGTPVLIRANISNDGIWPLDVDIFITGEWEDEKPAKAAKASADEGEDADGDKDDKAGATPKAPAKPKS